MGKKGWDYIKNYMGLGLTIVVVSAMVMLIFFCFYKFAALKSAIGGLIHILMPVIYGLIISYLLSPIYDWLVRWLKKFFSRTLHWMGQRMEVTAKTIAMVCTFAFMFLIIIGLLAMLIPRLITSISGIVATFPSTMNNLSATVRDFIISLTDGNPEAEKNAMAAYVQAVNYVENWVQSSVLPQVEGMFSYFTDMLLNMVMFLKNFAIGIVVAIYILASKKKFVSKAKKLLYAIFGARYGNFIMDNIRFADNAFGGFLIGKIVDSAIIGLITGVVLSIMNMPYALILAVVIGITNIIPFFGPFIGAVPCALVIFLVSPFKAMQFIIYIIIVQQFDGNVLGPKILGNTTGVSSFGVLFSIIFFGGLFGFVGMIIGVPLFAVITHLLTDLVNLQLERKNLPKNSQTYNNLKEIDEQSHKAIYKNSESEPVIIHDKRQRKEKEPDNPEDKNTQ